MTITGEANDKFNYKTESLLTFSATLCYAFSIYSPNTSNAASLNSSSFVLRSKKDVIYSTNSAL